MTDQLLRAKGSGLDRLTNPTAYDFRRMYGRSYYQFKPDYAHFWIILIFGEKLIQCRPVLVQLYFFVLLHILSAKTRYRVGRGHL